jgi:hypothetical protein
VRPQRAMFQLNGIIKDYRMKISTRKTKVTAFHGKYPVRTKIVTDDNPTEISAYFEYRGCDVTYEINKHMTQIIKTCHAISICGTI